MKRYKILLIAIGFIVWMMTLSIVYAFLFLASKKEISNLSISIFFNAWGNVFQSWIYWLLGFGITIIFVLLLLTKNKKSLYGFLTNKNDQIRGEASWLVDERTNKKLKLLRTVFKNNKNPGFVVKYQYNKNKFNWFVSEQKMVLLNGPTGTGKTLRVVIPSIYYNASLNDKQKPFMLISDPKGEIAHYTKQYLKNNGYDVITLNLSNTFNSSRWNPLDLIFEYWYEYYLLDKEESSRKFEALENVDTYVANVVEDVCGELSKFNGDKFFATSGKDLITGAIYYILEEQIDWDDVEGVKDNRYLNFLNVLNIISNSGPLREYLLNLDPEGINNKKWYFYWANTMMNKAQVTYAGIVGNASQAMRQWNNEGIKYLTTKSDFTFDFFSKDNPKPTAIFLIFPDEDNSRYMFAKLFIETVYREAIRASRKLPNQKLNRQLLMFLDEFANMPPFPEFAQKISIARSRNIFMLIVIQDLNQLSEMYGESKKRIIINNCQIQIILSVGQNTTLAEELVKSLGKQTILTRSLSNNSNSKKDVSVNESIGEKQLITMDQLMQLKSPYGILLIANQKPALLKFEICLKFKVFQNLPISENIENEDHEKEFNQQDFIKNIERDLLGSIDEAIEASKNLLDELFKGNLDDSEILETDSKINESSEYESILENNEIPKIPKLKKMFTKPKIENLNFDFESEQIQKNESEIEQLEFGLKQAPLLFEEAETKKRIKELKKMNLEIKNKLQTINEIQQMKGGEVNV